MISVYLLLDCVLEAIEIGENGHFSGLGVQLGVRLGVHGKTKCSERVCIWVFTFNMENK